MNEMLEETMKWLQVYEKTKKDLFIKEVQCQLFIILIKNNNDIDTIKESYNKLLRELDKYNHNYFSHICILLDLIKNARKMDENLQNKNTLSDFRYIEKTIKEDMLKEMSYGIITQNERNTRSCYKWLNYEEGLGEKIMKHKKTVLLKEAKEILDKKIRDIKEAQKCQENLKELIILTYGRWSREYERLLNIEQTQYGYPLTPNLAMLALRANIKRNITEMVNILDKFCYSSNI